MHPTSTWLTSVALALAVAPCSGQTPTVRMWGMHMTDTAVTLSAVAEVRASESFTLVRIIDGTVFPRGGGPTNFQLRPPTLPPGLCYTALAAGGMCVGIVSDGSVRQWDAYSTGVTYPLPTIASICPALRLKPKKVKPRTP